MPKHKLPITYNTGTPVGVLSEDPWNFLIYDRLFDNFSIVTNTKQQWLNELGFGEKVTALQLKSKESTVPVMYRSKKFAELAKADSKRKYVLYSPLDPPYKVNPLSLLMNSPAIAHAYENKRYFRDEFADLIRMPEYVIKYVTQLDKATSYHELREEFGDFVLQDEESSGSKGTFVVKSHDEYVQAVKSLKKNSSGRSIVVSKYVPGHAYSIQVCITKKYGIFSAGVQKQLVDSKYLCNPSLPGATKWCGGELGDTYPDYVQHQAREMATIVGSELASHGYTGIFGIDLVITPDNEVYAIEINARQTGYSHLISEMQLKQGKIPFMLLHALELGNYEYEVTDLDALPSTTQYKKPLSYMIINNPLAEDFVLDKEIKTGIYRLTGNRLVFEKASASVADLRGEDMVLITSRHNKGAVIGSGKRILKIMKLGKCMTGFDLNFKSQHLVAATKRTFKLPK